jgi:hypothetical protein
MLVNYGQDGIYSLVAIQVYFQWIRSPVHCSHYAKFSRGLQPAIDNSGV